MVTSTFVTGQPEWSSLFCKPDLLGYNGYNGVPQLTSHNHILVYAVLVLDSAHACASASRRQR